MIAEMREQGERTSKDGGVYNVEQKLQSYLRDKYSPAALERGKEDAIRILKTIAQQWCIDHNYDNSYNNYYQIAEDAINTYLSNWKDKKPGEDDRSHAFGRINSI